MDITERRAIEKSLQESEQRLSTALLAGRLGIFEWDIATGNIVWSATHYEIFGYPDGDLFPVQLHHFMDRIHPEDRQKIEDALQTAMRDRNPYAQECRIIWPDGSVHWVQGSGAFEYTESGVAFRMLGIAQDITARKHAEHGLLESEERYRTIVQNSPDIIFIQQGDSITFVNQAGISLLRAGTAENIVGRSPEEFVHSDFIEWFRTTLEILEQKPVVIASTTIQMIALDGTLIDAEVQASSILNDGQLQIQFVCRDITESKQAELELLRRTNDLERFNSAAVGRELRMIELKRQINELSEKCGLPRPYSLDFADG
jgi:PAS domain S-box-containing protein